MIVNSRALDAIIQFQVDEDTSIPTHRPLIAQFNWALTEQTISAMHNIEWTKFQIQEKKLISHEKKS